MDTKELGRRLRMIRKHFGITQKQLAADTQLFQSAISRLENGEEVYASVLLTVIEYYKDKVSLDYVFSHQFDRDGDIVNPMDRQLSLNRQLDILADMITHAEETSMRQIDAIRKRLG